MAHSLYNGKDGGNDTHTHISHTHIYYMCVCNIMLLILYWHGVHARKSHVLHCTLCLWGWQQNYNKHDNNINPKTYFEHQGPLTSHGG